MSLTGIPSRYFYTTATVQRRTNTINDVGDFTEAWNNIASNVPITIQPVSQKDLQDLQQGKEFETTHKAYIPLNIVTVRPNDRLISAKDGKTYIITGVQEHRAAREDVGIGHHYKLLLAIYRVDKS